jgi:putative phosphoribosyl transferase
VHALDGLITIALQEVKMVVSMQREDVWIGSQRLPGELQTPAEAVGLVVFVHGSGSSRRSPRNRFVADVMHGRRLATLLFDLLADAEAADRRNVFDIALLARRVEVVLAWLRMRPDVGRLPVGLFGASTGAAAALRAAAEQPISVGAVVSRGGRPDLAEDHLGRVQAPTLLIVGGDDPEVLELNRLAARRLHCLHRLEIVPGATHLFEEPGALDAVADSAARWFASRLSPTPVP